MRIEKQNTGREERTVLTGMVVDRAVLGRIASKWRGQMFASKWANIVGEWCVEYYKNYQKAPMKNMHGLFTNWASENKDKETIALVEKFLQGLSEEYEALRKESNTDYVLDVAGRHFERVGLARLAEEIQAELDLGKVVRARKKLAAYTRPEMGGGAGIDVMRDKEALRRAFDEDTTPLIEFKGALGKFFKGQLQRDSFIAIIAPEKRGKSFWLQELAWQAMLQRRKVAFFSVGDLTEGQMMRRLAQRAANRPRNARTVRYPVKMRKLPKKDVQVKFEERTWEERMTRGDARRAFERAIEKTRSSETLFRMSVHPMSSLSVAGMNSVLDDWEREGWVPDVIIVDYVDIMDMPDGEDERTKTNNTWKALRGVSQTRHCLVITATQANAASYTKETLDKSNFSEDKRKLAHVTGMFGLNQSKEEKKLGVYRLNWIVLRESEFYEDAVVYVAGALGMAKPHVMSCFQTRPEQGGKAA